MFEGWGLILMGISVQLEKIQTEIEQGKNEDALRELKALRKSIVDSFNLTENENAQNVVQMANAASLMNINAENIMNTIGEAREKYFQQICRLQCNANKQ